MPTTMPVVITVARQLGSGGSYIGQRVAQRLGYAYIDRQILQQAAIELGVEEAVLEDRDERLQGFWERLLTVFALGPPDGTYTPPPHLVTDADLIETERHLIPQLATRGPCVLLGHGKVDYAGVDRQMVVVGVKPIDTHEIVDVASPFMV